jgi:hypothetical protein
MIGPNGSLSLSSPEFVTRPLPQVAHTLPVQGPHDVDLRSELRRQSGEAIGAAPPAHPARDLDDKRVVDEAIVPVRTGVRLRFP